jgi:hypothetical protein
MHLLFIADIIFTVKFLSLNPLLECHIMRYKPFCHRKVLKKFSSDKLSVSFGLNQAEKYSRRSRGDWLHRLAGRKTAMSTPNSCFSGGISSF